MEQVPTDSISSCEMEQKQIYTMKNDFVFIERSYNDCKLWQTKHPQSLIVTWQESMQLCVVKLKPSAQEILFSMVNKWLFLFSLPLSSWLPWNSADMIISFYPWGNPFEGIILDASITL